MTESHIITHEAIPACGQEHHSPQASLFVNLFAEEGMDRVYFSKRFVTWGKDLKFLQTNGQIYPQNGNVRFYRYMRLEHLRKMVSEKLIAFLSPYQWSDPFEYLAYHPNTMIRNDKGKEAFCRIFALCGTYNYHNEDAKWTYTGSSDNGDDITIRVGFKLKELCQQLVKRNPTLRIYVTHMDYSLKKSEILKLLIARKKNNWQYENEYEYICEMCHKRPSFTYENEIRIFAVEDVEKTTTYEGLKFIAFDDCGIFRRLTIPPERQKPFCPQSEEDVLHHKEMLKQYKTTFFQHVDELKQELGALCPGVDVKRSTLYGILDKKNLSDEEAQCLEGLIDDISAVF